MSKKNINSKKWSIETKILMIFSILFLSVVLSGWIYAIQLRAAITQNNTISSLNPTALVEIERLRNIADSQISTSRSFFLLGSKALFDKQKKDKQQLLDSLANFEKQYNLAETSKIIKKIEALTEQNQDIFDQAMTFREKQTESKIVGQFYHSKTSPIRTQINESLDDIMRIQNTELERSRAEVYQAAHHVETQIPKAMTWFTGLLSLLFFGLVFLVLRMIKDRSFNLIERERLFNEATAAVHARDEIISAVSHDFNDSLNSLRQLAENLSRFTETLVSDSGKLIKSFVEEIDRILKDISDQKMADMGVLTLRLDQIGIDEVLEEAKNRLQPFAKKYDVRLQFDSANPPVLAFFDKDRILRVLENLVSNAIKFSPKNSKVVVKVRSDQKFVNISVIDNGSGIPEKQLSEIFTHFWQARKTTDQGPGIGLAIVKTIIEAHGGTVQVSSQAGQGSIFTFSLPRRRPVGAQLRKPTIVRPATSSSRSLSSIEINEAPPL